MDHITKGDPKEGSAVDQSWSRKGCTEQSCIVSAMNLGLDHLALCIGSGRKKPTDYREKRQLALEKYGGQYFVREHKSIGVLWSS